VVVAAVLAVGDLAHGRGWAGRAVARLTPTTLRPMLLAVGLLGVMLAATLSQQALLGSPLVQYLRGYPTNPRAAAARQVLAALPPNGPVAVTNVLGPHVPMRRQIYFFPGNRAYSPTLVQGAKWIIGDRLNVNNGERDAIRALIASENWRTVVEAGDYVLLERLR
jgi:hypothetical protein